MEKHRLEKSIRNLKTQDPGLKILSLMQIQSADTEILEQCAGFEELLVDLIHLKQAGERDIRFLSAKIVGRLQSVFETSDGPKNPYFGLSVAQTYEKIRHEADAMSLARSFVFLDRPTDMKQWEILLPLVEHEDERVRANLVEFMDKHWRPEFDGSVAKLLKDPSNRVRANTVVTLGKRKPQMVVDPLVEMLSESSLAMRESGLYCLENLPHNSVFAPWIRTALLETYTPLVVRAISAANHYVEPAVLDAMQSVFFETASRSVRQKIYAYWQKHGLPEAQKAEVASLLMKQKLYHIGTELFQELGSVEIYDPRLKAHYFLIVRMKDEMKVLMDSGAGSKSSDPALQMSLQSVQKGLKQGFIALGKSAFDLHQNRDYFFEQCHKAENQIASFLKLLPKD